MPKNIATPLFDITTVIVTLTKSVVRRSTYDKLTDSESIFYQHH